MYRLVKMDYVVRSEDGERHLTVDAFRGGKARRISVDRAKKCNYDPRHTQRGTDPVCRLVAEEVRSIDVGTKMSPKGKIIQRYEARVESTPKHDNIAHADIYAHPEKASKRAFKLPQEGLAAYAKWQEGFEPKS